MIHLLLFTVTIGGKIFQFLLNIIGYTLLILLVMDTRTNQILVILVTNLFIHSRHGPVSWMIFVKMWWRIKRSSYAIQLEVINHNSTSSSCFPYYHHLLVNISYCLCVGLVGLQAAVMEPQICRGMILLNISLRMLHIKKQPWFGRPLIRSFQNLLR